jgi:hypothetical protein
VRYKFTGGTGPVTAEQSDAEFCRMQ